MSRRRQSGTAQLWVLPVVLVVGTGLFLGARSWTAAHIVMNPPAPSALATSQTSVPEVDQARTADRALAAANLEGRDPMHRFRRPAPPPRPRPKPKPKEPEPLRPPVLRMLMVDNVNPVVQLYEGGVLSPRLQVGDVWRGWTVDSIGARSVLVSKEGESFTLTLRRDQ